VVAEGGSFLNGALLALVTTLTHTGSVILLALVLWRVGAFDVAGVHQVLTHASGFLIAAVGVWRLGRLAGGFAEHADDDHVTSVATRRGGRLVGLGVAGGVVPCWDVVGLIVLAAALGRFGLGVLLAVAFSAGMGLVLVGFGWLVARLRASLGRRLPGSRWEKGLALSSAVTLAGLGLVLLIA
jgi:ABC-type nickel/cobalt efflux system permease component RcnA